MVKCPECSKAVDADFGMTTCPHCSTVFMVELDGSVSDPVAESDPESLVEEGEQQLMEEPQEEPQEELPPVEDLFSEPEQNQQEIDSESSPDDAHPEEEMFFSEESVAEHEEANDSLKDPLELQIFDESGDSELSNGELLYDVIVHGLDSADLKKDIFAALMDKRFALSAEDMRRNLKSGVLTLVGVNPVRAMLIVLKMQEYDVAVEWRQRHFAQATPKEEEPTP